MSVPGKFPFPFWEKIPVLRMFDVAKAREFHIEFLEFTVDWEHRIDETAPVYLQMSRAGLTLHLSGHQGDGRPGSTVFVRMQGIAEFQRELAAKNSSFTRPGLEPSFHGTLSLEVTDPFGNRLRFHEPVIQ